MQAAGEGLAEGPVHRVEGEWDYIRLVPWNNHIISKTAVAVDTDRPERLAKVDPAGAALRAASTGNVRVAGDAGTDGDIAYVPADRFNDAAELVAERHGRGRWKRAVQEVSIRAADTAGLDTNQEITRAGRGLVYLAHEQVNNRLEPQRLHDHASPAIFR